LLAPDRPDTDRFPVEIRGVGSGDTFLETLHKNGVLRPSLNYCHLPDDFSTRDLVAAKHYHSNLVSLGCLRISD